MPWGFTLPGHNDPAASVGQSDDELPSASTGLLSHGHDANHVAVNSQPVQHFRSNEATNHYNDHFSIDYTAPSFNDDPSTLIDSTNDALHTPQIPDLLWQRHYHEETDVPLDYSMINDAGTGSMTAAPLTEPLRPARNRPPSRESTDSATSTRTGSVLQKSSITQPSPASTVPKTAFLGLDYTLPSPTPRRSAHHAKATGGPALPLFDTEYPRESPVMSFENWSPGTADAIAGSRTPSPMQLLYRMSTIDEPASNHMSMSMMHMNHPTHASKGSLPRDPQFEGYGSESNNPSGNVENQEGKVQQTPWSNDLFPVTRPPLTKSLLQDSSSEHLIYDTNGYANYNRSPQPAEVPTSTPQLQPYSTFSAYPPSKPSRRYADPTTTHNSSMVAFDGADFTGALGDKLLMEIREQIKQVNPRLEPYLMHRLAQDHFLRYRRLAKWRADHADIAQRGNCPSGRLCFFSGGKVEHPLSLPSSLRVAKGSDNESENLDERIAIGPESLPDGIPLPPTKHLPARFECPICFQVKSFRKPSDWAKHVHEDVQPFTCTFQDCVEPKSFKRKADWVRHESERHRHLEWWQCSLAECRHTCYRKDNFIQHLVREHKRKEPKLKRSSRSAVVGLNKEEQEFWDLVNQCHHESGIDPKTIPCSFCKNSCNTWKKRSVHVAKHMEQIALPVFDLVQQRRTTGQNMTAPQPQQHPGSLLLPSASPEVSQYYSEIVDPSCLKCNRQMSISRRFHLLCHDCQPRITPPPDSPGMEPQDVPTAPQSRLPTDSGYASINPKGLPVEGGEDTYSITSGQEERTSTWETQTNYSEGISLETTRRDGFIQGFVDLLLKDVSESQLTIDTISNLTEGLKGLLGDFAVRLGQESSSVELRRAMTFIHKYRSSIGYTLEQTITTLPEEDDEDDVNHPDPPEDRMPIDDLMKMWYDGKEEGGGPPPARSPTPEIDEASLEELDERPDEIVAYERLLSSTISYQWLVATLRNFWLLTTTGNDAQQAIRAKVMQVFPKPAMVKRTVSIPPLEATFDMEHDMSLEDQHPGAIELGTIVTVTGSAQDAQALTCSEYMQQTWPVTGLHTMQLLQDTLNLKSGSGTSTQRTDGTAMTGCRNGSAIRVCVIGSRDIITEVAEQLCWLNAALASPPVDTGLMSWLPSIEHIITEHHEDSENVSGTTTKLEGLSVDDSVSYSWRTSSRPNTTLQPQTAKATKSPVAFRVTRDWRHVANQNEPGMCWHSLFRRCVIVQGFPIKQRAKLSSGLEIPLNVVAKLIDTKYLNEFAGYTFLKGFRTMLAPAEQIDDLMIWHLRSSDIEDTISYLDHGMDQLCKIGPEEVVKFRHVVGWCAKVTNTCGMSGAKYEVESSPLASAGPNGVLYDCAMTFGRPLSGGTNFRLTADHEPISVSRRNYLDMFRYLESRFVLFWDTRDDRGWLVNGLRALLHLVRQSIKINEDEDAGGFFVLSRDDLDEPADPDTAQAAREFLSKKNLAVKLTLSQLGQGEDEYETMADRMQQFYDILEKGFTHQKRCKTWAKIPRSQLEGWDFSSMAQKDDSIEPLMCSLPSLGKGWVDLTRAVGAITLFGEGFDEIFKPKAHPCISLPCNKFYIAVMASDIRRMFKANKCDSKCVPRMISRSPPLIWHSPSGSVNWCSTMKKPKPPFNHNIVQVIWSKEFANLLPPPIENSTLSDEVDGAVIFGHNDTLSHYIADFGPPIPGIPPDPIRELEMFEDSGIGSSIDTRITPTAWPPQTMSHNPSQPPHGFDTQNSSYGTSNITGGYAVLGNVTGNLSVNQYFGISAPVSGLEAGFELTRSISAQPAIPIHNLSSTPLQSHTQPMAESRSKSDSAVETLNTISQQPNSQFPNQASIPNQSIPFGVSIDTAMDTTTTKPTDSELQQAELEIRAMGLEGYCHVLQF